MRLLKLLWLQSALMCMWSVKRPETVIFNIPVNAVCLQMSLFSFWLAAVILSIATLHVNICSNKWLLLSPPWYSSKAKSCCGFLLHNPKIWCGNDSSVQTVTWEWLAWLCAKAAFLGDRDGNVGDLFEAPFQIALVGIVIATVGTLYTVCLDTLR